MLKKHSACQKKKMRNMENFLFFEGAIMILSASTEFDRTRNPIIVDRPSDNIELPKVSSSMK